MSRERARRRAEREAVAQAERQRRARALTRRRRWAAVSRSMPFRRTRTRRSALRTHRSRQNGILLAVLLSAHTVLWLLQPSWWLRASAAVLTVLAWPVLVVLLFDRRSSG